MQVKKRDNKIAEFNEKKISRVIYRAMKEAREGGRKAATDMAQTIVKKIAKKKTVSVEEIQDLVEVAMLENGLLKTARQFISYRDTRRAFREEQRSILHGTETRWKGTLNSLRVISSRYANENKDGSLESPEDIFYRVANELALVEDGGGEEWIDQFYDVMWDKKFLPAGRTLRNAGSGTALIPNCLVIDIEDSMEGILNTLKHASLHQQVGCGLGFPFHRIRPAGLSAKRTQGEASGPISFLRAYDAMFGTIKQQNRHGANMATFSVEHPDILDFISCKTIEGDIKNFNISVLLTDKFMKAAQRDDKTPWKAIWNDKEMNPRVIRRSKFGQVDDIQDVEMTAYELLHRIAEQAWLNGEPGVFFYDRAQETNVLPEKGTLEATNPCGEQFLHHGANCNLGSINLAAFVDHNGKFLEDDLKETTKIAIRMLDNVIDIMTFPEQFTQEAALNERRIGLGIMGLADMLIKMSLPYDSADGRKAATKAMQIINETAYEYSEKLGEEKGNFPDHPQSTYEVSMRNAMRTTIAPTGSISMVYDISGGVEPYFALQYHYDNILGGKTRLDYFNPLLEDALHDSGIELDSKERAKIKKRGSIQDIKRLPLELRKIFRVAMDISSDNHIRMQAFMQKHVDNSISKTINMSNSANVEDVISAWFKGWESGLKSMTVYRDKSRELQVLNLGGPEEPKESNTINSVKKCSECGSVMVAAEGCYSCPNPHCGVSLCD